MTIIISTTPVTNAWTAVGTAYRALTTAIRKKPQPNTVELWQKFALACQILANAMWDEERARQPVMNPPDPVPPPPVEEPFDPRITTWVDVHGNPGFDFPSCPFKVGNP
jgi:hypothetical protein